MPQHYSNPKRESEPYALPDLETFYLTDTEAKVMYCETAHYGGSPDDDEAQGYTAGWYYWYCLPGCLPDSEPIGPFASEDEALADARMNAYDLEHDSDEDEPTRCSTPECFGIVARLTGDQCDACLAHEDDSEDGE